MTHLDAVVTEKVMGIVYTDVKVSWTNSKVQQKITNWVLVKVFKRLFLSKI